MKKIINFFKGFLLALRVLLKPSNGIIALIKFGNIISKTKAYEYALEEIRSDKESQKLIDQRYSLGFNDLESFSSYKEGTLGHEYYCQMKKLKLSCYPIKLKKEYSEAEYVRERRREIHDLLHVILGYKTDLVGEASLNSFLVAKAKMPTCIIIVVGIIIRTTFKQPKNLALLMDSIFEAYNRGKRAKSPFSIKWEETLDMRVSDVRSLMGV